MSMLKVYQWEREKWPEFRKVKLTGNEIDEVLKRSAADFKMPVPKLLMKRRRKCGRIQQTARYRIEEGVIELWIDSLTLATLLHEIAHHLSWCRYRDKWHREVFKQCLKLVYSWVDGYLVELAEAEREGGE